MKIDRTYYETAEWNGKKEYEKISITKGVEAYTSGYDTVLFETETDEKIGIIRESENWTNFKSYYGATCLYGWDGEKSTRKQYTKDLCTRGLYNTALRLLMKEYMSRKNAE